MGFRRLAILTLALAAPPLLATGPVTANTLEYTLDLPPNQMVTYLLELDVVRPGRVIIDVDWTAPRMLTLRVERPRSSGTDVHTPK